MAELFLRRQLLSVQDHPVHHGIYWLWQGQSDADATWEPLEQFKESHPDFQLEDKLFSYGEGSVVDRFFGHKFQRRNKKAASTSG